MRQSSSIFSAALLLSSGILLSRLLGYAREMLLAYQFGAGSTMDAFYAAFQIPDLLNYFLAGGALSIAFIPLYNKAVAKEGQAAADSMMAVVLGTLGVVVIAATALLWWQAPALVRLQFPKFSDETTALTIHLTRIVLPAQIFFVTGGIMQAVLLARKSFMAAALAPLVYNTFIIAGGVLLYSVCGIDGFAYGTLVGAVAGPFLVPLLYARGHVPFMVRFSPFDKRFLIYLALAAPLMLGQTLLTLDEWYGRWFGALLDEGTVAHLGYARRLMLVPIAVIGQAIAAAALPTLSALWAEGKTEEMNRALQKTLEIGLFVSVVAGAGFFVVAKPLVALVYEHGRFDAEDAVAVGRLAQILAFAIPGWIMQQITVRAFYARGDTWRPMVLGTCLSLLAIPLYLILSREAGEAGIAIAGATGMVVNALATLALARRLHGAPLSMKLIESFVRAAGISVPAAAIGIFGGSFIKNLFASAPLGGKIEAMLDLSLSGGLFSIFAVMGMFMFGGGVIRAYVMSMFCKLIKPRL